MDITMWELLRRAQPDTQQPKTAGFPKPAVSPDALLGTICALTALSLLFLPARLYARWKTLHRLFWDDFLVVFAWIASLAITVTVAEIRDMSYVIMAVADGERRVPHDIKIISMIAARAFTSILIVLYTGLWAVKAAFLIFFRQLGIRSVTSLNRWWWIVVSATILCYMLCFATLPYHCTLVSFRITISPECSTQGLSFISMRVNCVLDVITDCLIMSIPFLILWRVRISTRQKIALSAIFSMVVITIVFAIIRATITTVHVKQQIDPPWMYLWTSVELNVAIIVACIAPYRALFVRDRSGPIPRNYRSPLSVREKALKMFRSSETRSRNQREEDTWSITELPYLAPWPDVEGGAETPRSNNDKRLDSGGHQNSSRCDEPWLTADLPHLQPWYENGRHERTRELHNAEAMTPIPRAHVRGYNSMP